VVNSYLLPDVLFDLPRKVGLAFDLSVISSGIYGAILLIVMLLRPHGLVLAGRLTQRPARPPSAKNSRSASVGASVAARS
jgi:ABC-type branched-subunit amino acid transport system permease subunit